MYLALTLNANWAPRLRMLYSEAPYWDKSMSHTLNQHR